MIKATLKVLGKYYTAEGESVVDAISALKPGNAKGVGILTLSNGERTKERVIQAPIVFRLFNTAGMSRDIAIKNASQLFDL